MRSTFHGLETAKRSLFTQQAALSTTGHNIANANTAGYSRQVVNMAAARPIEAVGLMRSNAPGQLGTGVEFTSITRMREKFLDDQYRNENKSYGSWTIQSDTMEKLEAIINEPSDTGIRKVLDSFWKSWSDLSKDPENVTGRKIVKENAIALANAFNFTSKQLQDLQNDLSSNIEVKTKEINSLTSSIASLNKEIQRIEGLGDHANDLRDQRDILTDQLSGIVNISVTESSQGYTIRMGNTNLVTGGAPIPITSASLISSAASGELAGGEVHGMIVSRDKYVTDYIAQLDTLANTIVNGEFDITIPAGSILPDNMELEVKTADGYEKKTFTSTDREIKDPGLTVRLRGINGLHKLGYTMSGNMQAGGDFFVGSGAANFQVHSDIVNNAANIATSMRTVINGTTETVVKGNNTLALLMSNMKDMKFKFSGGNLNSDGSISDFYHSIVGQLGVQGSEASRQSQNQKVLVEQVDSRRQSVSGVSLDEEMSNMIKFQHAYNAAARFMTSLDEILDKVINGMGTVGR